MSLHSLKDYARAKCYRPDKPETYAFVYPADQIVFYNLAAYPTANIYDLCFDSIEDCEDFMLEI